MINPIIVIHCRIPEYQLFCQGIMLQDIDITDEVGFYQALHNKSLSLKGDKCSGAKHSKVRLTGMPAANTLSGKIPVFVIKPISLEALIAPNFCTAEMGHNKKVGCPVICLKSVKRDESESS